MKAAKSAKPVKSDMLCPMELPELKQGMTVYTNSRDFPEHYNAIIVDWQFFENYKLNPKQKEKYKELYRNVFRKYAAEGRLFKLKTTKDEAIQQKSTPQLGLYPGRGIREGREATRQTKKKKSSV